MKTQIAVAAMLFLIAAGPAADDNATRPTSTFASRADEYLKNAEHLQLKQAEKDKIRADAKAVDSSIAKHTTTAKSEPKMVKALYEGRPTPGMTEAELDLIVLPYRVERTDTAGSSQFTCQSRDAGSVKQYVITLTNGIVTVVSDRR